MTQRSPIALALLTSSLALTACGGGSDSSEPTPQPPAPSNTAPTDIVLSNDSVDENAMGAEIGQLTASDSDSGDSFTFSTEDSRFVIEGDMLSLAADVAMNYEAMASTEVSVTVTDSAGATFSKPLTIMVNDLLDYYAFPSRFGADTSVSYSGQTTRHVLIAELNHYIGNQLLADLDSGVLTSREEVLAKLNSFYLITPEDYDLVADSFPVSFMEGTTQTVLRDLSSSHKDLSGKIAGNDAVGQYQDWNNGAFVGWGAAGSTSPEGLVNILFGLLADNAEQHLGGAVRMDPFGNPISAIYLNDQGHDLKQLIQKHLLGAVAYSQGADDYLDNDTEGKGLLADNVDNVEMKGYTALEHVYDEGFGYFGAARDYLDYSDDELAAAGGREAYASGYFDSNGDGTIDLFSEFNFGNSTNAAKRDRGSAANAMPTDYTAQAMNAFLMGRQIISDAEGALTEAQATALQEQVTLALDAWERAIVTTVIHYINDSHADLATLGTADFDYATLAKHWSEMKGFALNLQFNRQSPLSAEQFAQLHSLMGDAPVLSGDVAAYQAQLMQARQILATAYGFDPANVENW